MNDDAPTDDEIWQFRKYCEIIGDEETIKLIDRALKGEPYARSAVDRMVLYARFED